MAKRTNKAKRSLQSLPKGLPSKKRAADQLHNPFDTTSTRNKKPKHDVHNRQTNKAKPSKLAASLSQRQELIHNHVQSGKKVNTFVDRRMGEYDPSVTPQEQAMARLVKERMRRSKRTTKYALSDEATEDLLTHRGNAINDANARDHVMLSDEEDGGGDLEAVDTELHFGGGNMKGAKTSQYGPTSTDLNSVYSQRKTELDDLIARRKVLKAEKMQSKEQQTEAFETMDESFKDLAQLLQFRDKKQERKEREALKAQGLLPQEDQDMQDWDKEMKEYLFERKVKATDRTKTPEEIAKEEADRLHKLETRRLARMNGDFEDDEFSDISGDEGGSKKRKKKPSKNSTATAEKLDDSDDEDHRDNEAKVRFTSEGLVHVDEDGNVLGKVGEEEDESQPDSDQEEEDEEDQEEQEKEEQDSDDDEESHKEEELEGYDSSIVLSVDTRVNANYRVKEQFGEQAKWYAAKITQVNKNKGRTFTYNVEYDDGDFEDDVTPDNVRPLAKTTQEMNAQLSQKEVELALKQKRQKAKLKARYVHLYLLCVYSIPRCMTTKPFAHCAPLTLVTGSSSRASCSALFLAAWLCNTEINPMPHSTLETIFNSTFLCLLGYNIFICTHIYNCLLLQARNAICL
jgi:nucleolar protein 14